VNISNEGKTSDEVVALKNCPVDAFTLGHCPMKSHLIKNMNTYSPKSDGNCLYRCLSKLIFNDENNYMKFKITLANRYYLSKVKCPYFMSSAHACILALTDRVWPTYYDVNSVMKKMTHYEIFNFI
jgi:hypothetical protein